MKFTHFFIARPIFAIVLSLLMLLAGAIAFLKLPLSELSGRYAAHGTG